MVDEEGGLPHRGDTRGGRRDHPTDPGAPRAGPPAGRRLVAGPRPQRARSAAGGRGGAARRLNGGEGDEARGRRQSAASTAVRRSFLASLSVRRCLGITRQIDCFRQSTLHVAVRGVLIGGSHEINCLQNILCGGIIGIFWFCYSCFHHNNWPKHFYFLGERPPPGVVPSWRRGPKRTSLVTPLDHAQTTHVFLVGRQRHCYQPFAPQNTAGSPQ